MRCLKGSLSLRGKYKLSVKKEREIVSIRNDVYNDGHKERVNCNYTRNNDRYKGRNRERLREREGDYNTQTW